MCVNLLGSRSTSPKPATSENTELNPPAPVVLEAIVRHLAPDARIVGASRMEGGQSATMTSIELEGPDRKRDTVILRQAGDANLAADPDTVVNEARVLDALNDAGLPVPRPLNVDVSLRVLPKPFLVVTFLEGAPDYDPANREAAALEMAGFLAGLHAVDASRTDLASVPRRNGPLDGAPVGREGLPGTTRSARDLLDSFWPPPARNPDALLHGDLGPATYSGRTASSRV